MRAFSRSRFFWPVLIFCLALLLRLAHLLEFSSSVFFHFPVLDSAMYEKWGLEIASGRFLWDRVHIHGPLYAYFLSVFFFLKQGLFMVRFSQVLIGSLNCVLLYFLGKRYFDPRIGVLSAVAAAVYWPFIYFDVRLLTPFLSIFFNLSALILLKSAFDEQDIRLFFLSGIILGLSALTRPDVLIFAFLLIIFLFIFRSHWKNSLAMLTGLLLLLAPVTSYNYLVSKEFIPVHRNIGLNFYLGNNPESTGTPYLRPGVSYEELKILPKASRESTKNAFYLRSVYRFLVERPFDYLKLLFKKSYLTFGDYEVKASQEIYPQKNASRLLSFLPIGFGLISSLALIGSVLAFNSARLILYLYAAAYLFSSIFIITSSRYRLPLVPIFILFASYAAFWIFQESRKRKLRFVFLVLVIASFLFWLFTANLFALKTESEHYYFEKATAYKKAGQHHKALLNLNKVIELRPSDYDAFNMKGFILYDLGAFASAEAAFRASLKLDPDYLPAEVGLAVSLFNQKRWKEASFYFDRALKKKDAPEYLYYLAGKSALELNDPKKAKGLFLRQIELYPGSSAAKLAKMELSGL